MKCVALLLFFIGACVCADNPYPSYSMSWGFPNVGGSYDENGDKGALAGYGGLGERNIGGTFGGRDEYKDGGEGGQRYEGKDGEGKKDGPVNDDKGVIAGYGGLGERNIGGIFGGRDEYKDGGRGGQRYEGKDGEGKKDALVNDNKGLLVGYGPGEQIIGAILGVGDVYKNGGIGGQRYEGKYGEEKKDGQRYEGRNDDEKKDGQSYKGRDGLIDGYNDERGYGGQEGRKDGKGYEGRDGEKNDGRYEGIDGSYEGGRGRAFDGRKAHKDDPKYDQRFPKTTYFPKLIGRQGLGFQLRNFFSSGMRFPITPEILQPIGFRRAIKDLYYVPLRGSYSYSDSSRSSLPSSAVSS